MRKSLQTIALTLLCGTLCTVSQAHAEPQLGKPAPSFTAKDSNGQTVNLADFKGKEVVLEWSNDACPFVRKWYGSGEMQKLQKEAADKGAVWLTVISSAPGKQGFVSGDQANKDTATRNAHPAHVLLDPDGTIGRLYNAMTTPDIYVIAQDGTLAYMGGADSIATSDPSDIAKAEPYAREAIDAVANNQPVKNPVTKPYGCNVKYD